MRGVDCCRIISVISSMYLYFVLVGWWTGKLVSFYRPYLYNTSGRRRCWIRWLMMHLQLLLVDCSNCLQLSGWRKISLYPVLIFTLLVSYHVLWGYNAFQLMWSTAHSWSFLSLNKKNKTKQKMHVLLNNDQSRGHVSVSSPHQVDELSCVWSKSHSALLPKHGLKESTDSLIFCGNHAMLFDYTHIYMHKLHFTVKFNWWKQWIEVKCLSARKLALYPSESFGSWCFAIDPKWELTLPISALSILRHIWNALWPERGGTGKNCIPIFKNTFHGLWQHVVCRC